MGCERRAKGELCSYNHDIEEGVNTVLIGAPVPDRQTSASAAAAAKSYTVKELRSFGGGRWWAPYFSKGRPLPNHLVRE